MKGGSSGCSGSSGLSSIEATCFHDDPRRLLLGPPYQLEREGEVDLIARGALRLDLAPFGPMIVSDQVLVRRGRLAIDPTP